MKETYQPQSYEHLLGMEGFSEELLRNHFTLYEGYVKNTNALLQQLEEMAPEGPVFAELTRRFGWEFNGMRLHELYFGNLSPDPMSQPEGRLQKEIEEQFGSLEQWKERFVATGAMRGIGWVVLAYDKDAGRLLNLWINEHDLGHLAGATPLVVMDVFEHAFVLDYGLDRGAYIQAFMKSLDWGVVQRRLEEVLS